MKSYEIIKDIGNKLYVNLRNEGDVKVRLEESVQRIHSQISQDFKSLFGMELNLINYYLYVDDETYRQSATGLILVEAILNSDGFKVRVECLIDFGRIWIKVSEGRDILDFKDIVNRIEKVQNVEGVSELKEIK